MNNNENYIAAESLINEMKMAMGAVFDQVDAVIEGYLETAPMGDRASIEQLVKHGNKDKISDAIVALSILVSGSSVIEDDQFYNEFSKIIIANIAKEIKEGAISILIYGLIADAIESPENTPLQKERLSLAQVAILNSGENEVVW